VRVSRNAFKGGTRAIPAVASRAEESENQPNKVLEHQHAERLDFGTTGLELLQEFKRRHSIEHISI
jgi:hypothetical protein